MHASRIESIFFIPQPKDVVGTQKNRLNETVLLSTQNTFKQEKNANLLFFFFFFGLTGLLDPCVRFENEMGASSQDIGNKDHNFPFSSYLEACALSTII